MWRRALAALARSGRRAIAPDLPGFGDSPPDPPGTWERHIEAVERFRRALEVDRCVLVVHDWGGLIGLRWACDNPGAVAALVISSTGFFPDGRWHGLARQLRTEGDGERMLAEITREGVAQMLNAVSRGYDDAAADEYWKTLSTEAGRRGVLELYRSGEFEKLAPYEGKLGALGVPTMMLWGENDVFAPVAGAHRLKHEIPHAEIVVLEGAGHFIYADEPDRTAEEIVAFLDRAGV